MTTIDRIQAVLSRWPLVLIGLLVGLGLGFGATKMMAPSHTANAKVFVVVGGSQNAADMNSASLYAASQMSSYETAASSPIVLAPVIQQLKLNMTPTELGKDVTATASKDSFVLDIVVSDPDAQRAADIANAIAAQMGTAIKDLTPVDKSGVKPLSSKTITPAVADTSGAASSMIRNMAGLSFLGMLAGVVFALLLEARAQTSGAHLRRSPRDEADVDGGAK